PWAAAHLAAFVEVARENFMLDPGGIARRRGPAAVHVYAGKFKVRLLHRHGSSPAIVASSSRSPPWAASVPHTIRENARRHDRSNIWVSDIGIGPARKHASHG